MKVIAENQELTFKFVDDVEYINFLKVLDQLCTGWCNRHAEGRCSHCLLTSVVDDDEWDLCDLITALYNNAVMH